MSAAPAAFVQTDGPVDGESYVWRPVAIGGGGFITGMSFSNDGLTHVVRTDVYGAYRWDAVSDRWIQMVTAASMPREARNVDAATEGVYEIAVAPGDGRHLLMALKGRLYRSDDGGDHWTMGDSPELRFDANAAGRYAGPFLSISPTDPQLAFFGTASQGLWRTVDGGTRWSQVSLGHSAGAGTDGPGIVTWFGRGGPKGAGAVYAAVPNGGLFWSLDNGQKFTPLGRGTGPQTIWRASQFPDGSILAVDMKTQGAFILKGGVWRSLTGDGLLAARPFVGAAVAPNGKVAIVVDEGGRAWCSRDQGARWARMSSEVRPGAQEPPWLRVNNISFFTTGSLYFDPRTPNRVWNASGTGPYYADLPEDCGALNWISQVRGIEELVAMDVVQAPGHAPVFAAMDFGIHVKPDLDRFSETYGPQERVIIAAQQLAWTKADPNFLVTNASDTRTDCCAEDGASVLAGVSHNGGASWTRFASLPHPPGTQEDDPWRMAFGTIAVAADSTGNIVWEPAYDRAPFYTRNGGESWERVKFPGEILPHTGSFGSIWFQRKTLAADRVAPGTFYLYHNGTDSNPTLGGLWRTVDGGANWTMRFIGEIAPDSEGAAKLRAVPGQAGHLFFTAGLHNGLDTGLRRSTDGGAKWVPVKDVTGVDDIAFGKAAKGASYPAIYLSGRVGGQYGIWRSVDNAAHWTRLVEFPLNSLDQVTVIEADKDVFGRVFIGYMGSGWIYGAPANCKTLPAVKAESVCSPIG